MQAKLKKYSNDEAYRKLMQFCSYQERCHKEIRDKLYEWGFDSEVSGKIIVKLIEADFLNEERYARSFIRGKFKYKHWGRLKIRQELKGKGITDNLIRIAFGEIDEDEYLNTIKKLLVIKLKQIKEKNPRIRNHKAIQFLAGKGFEASIVMELLKDKEE